MNFVDIVFSSFLANNLLFFHFLGLGEFLKTNDSVQPMRRTAILAFMVMASSILYWIPDHFVLQPLHLEFLRSFLLLLILGVVISVYSAAGSLPGPWPPARDYVVHTFLVGGVLLVGSSSPNLFEVMTAALAVVLGYALSLVLLGSVFQRLSRERIPVLVQGLPLQLLTLGLVWLVLHGLGFAFAQRGL